MLNTIYVTSEGAWLRKDGANVVVEVEGAERGRAPLHMLDGVVSFGRRRRLAGAAGGLRRGRHHAVATSTPNGRFLARVEGPRTGNVLLRRAQYRVADDPAAPGADRARHRGGQGRQPARRRCAARCATTARRCTPAARDGA